VLIELSSKSARTSFDANEREPLLYAALRAGLSLPYECASGTCGTCKARRLTGVVIGDWPESPGSAFLKKERDEVLMCQTRALSDCSFELPGATDFTKAPPLLPSFGRASIERVEPLTADVASVHVGLERPIEFDAGQFVALKAPHVPGYRAYSMANFARPAEQLEFVVKLKPDGRLTPWLVSGEAVGASLDCFGPLGKATFQPQEQRTLVCIAGGSGLASMLSILELGGASRHFDHFDAAIFFGVRTRSDVFFLDRLAAFAMEFPDRLRITVALSHDAPPPELAQAYPQLSFESGFPHEIAARQLAGNFAGRVAYVAGPPILVDVSIRMLITQARLPARDIRYDKFN
jgi:toluene monooxygenase electron transfer component